MQKVIRHGDLCLVKISKLPTGLEQAKTKAIMKGSGGNDHSTDTGKIYFKTNGDFIFGYLKAKDTKLYHIEHGKVVKGKSLREAKIPDGIYELRRQNEYTHEGMKQVID